jgi:hypothetical protein
MVVLELPLHLVQVVAGLWFCGKTSEPLDVGKVLRELSPRRNQSLNAASREREHNADLSHPVPCRKQIKKG